MNYCLIFRNYCLCVRKNRESEPVECPVSSGRGHEKNPNGFFEGIFWRYSRGLSMLREDKENSSEFLDCAQSGTAEGCGEDFHSKILDCGAFVRRTLQVLLMSHLFEIQHAEAPKSVKRIFL